MKLPELASAILRRCLRRCALPFAIGIALAGFAPTMDLATAKKLPPHAKRAVVAKAVAPASAIPAEPFSNDVPAKSELTVGGLHATLAADDLKTAIAAGGSAYLNVTIAEAGGNQQVSLIAEAEAGSIRSISGTGVKSSPVAGGAVSACEGAAGMPRATRIHNPHRANILPIGESVPQGFQNRAG